MYGTPENIRELCVNIQTSISDNQIEAAARFVDARLDAALAEVFYWPDDSDGNPIDPIPPLIVAVAELLVAGRLESRFYAQNEAQGFSSNPYGKRLERDGETALQEIIEGMCDARLGLERVANITANTPAQRFELPSANRTRTPFGRL